MASGAGRATACAGTRAGHAHCRSRRTRRDVQPLGSCSPPTPSPTFAPRCALRFTRSSTTARASPRRRSPTVLRPTTTPTAQHRGEDDQHQETSEADTAEQNGQLTLLGIRHVRSRRASKSLGNSRVDDSRLGADCRSAPLAQPANRSHPTLVVDEPICYHSRVLDPRVFAILSATMAAVTIGHCYHN